MKSVPLSAYQETLGMIYFARMLDKIRLHAAGNLRDDFCENLGSGLDGRCVNFLRVPYADLAARTLLGGSDEDILRWCFENGREPNEGDIFVWNQFLKKVGWQDGVSEILGTPQTGKRPRRPRRNHDDGRVFRIRRGPQILTGGLHSFRR